MNEIRQVLSFNDVLLVPRNSELKHLSDCDIEINYDNCHLPFKCLPIINAPMETVNSPMLNNILTETFNIPTTIHRCFNNVKEQIKFFEDCKYSGINQKKVFIAVGSLEKWKRWIDDLIEYRENNVFDFGLLVDMANGDCAAEISTVKYIRSLNTRYLNIMSGNVCTKSGYLRLQDAGSDFIRTGIGGSSVCSTRTNCGMGLPTLTSILDCAKVKDTAYLLSDGGIENSGDICKSMASGADMVMLGKVFASTLESASEKYNKDFESIDYRNFSVDDFYDENKEIKWCLYRGMASKEVAEKLKSRKSSISIEGLQGYIKYQGTVSDVVNGIIGNLRSSMAYYGGAKNWKDYQKRIKMVQITQQGWMESLTRVLE
jgi:IMP dehydrogenase/GMP reductase